MTTKYKCLVPSPKDVLENPLSLFVRSVITCDEDTLSLINSDNYLSYIVAIGKDTLDALDHEQELHNIQIAARVVDNLIKQKHIQIRQAEYLTMYTCKLLPAKEEYFRKWFGEICDSLRA